MNLLHTPTSKIILPNKTLRLFCLKKLQKFSHEYISVSNVKSLLADMYHSTKAELQQRHLIEINYHFNCIKTPLYTFEKQIVKSKRKMDKKTLYIIIILMLSLTQTVLCFAQSNQTIHDSIPLNNELPELSVLIESALKNSPLLKVSDKEISQIFEQIKMDKKSWSNYLLLDANAKYGLYNQLSLSDISSSTAVEASIKSKKEQLNYYLGITFRMPISDIVNKKSELKILNETIEQKQQQKEEIKNQIQLLIVEKYYNLIYLNKSMKINQDMLQSLTISQMKIERDIQSGISTLESFNSMVVQKGKVEDSFNKTKSEYFAEYKKLMMICGIK